MILALPSDKQVLSKGDGAQDLLLSQNTDIRDHGKECSERRSLPGAGPVLGKECRPQVEEAHTPGLRGEEEEGLAGCIP